MTGKSSDWRTISSSSSTKTWTSLDQLPPAQRATIEKLLAGGKVDGNELSREFLQGDSGGDSQDQFVVEFNGDAVTVNGRRYDSIDAVPFPERERVQALRASFGPGTGMTDIFNENFSAGGVDATPPADGYRAETMGRPAAPDRGTARANASPGAVPPSRAMRRVGQFLVVVVCAAVAWLVSRWLAHP